MGIRNEQKEQRREEILDAALDLFIKKGYTGTTIKDIASAVNMSVGLLFHYFDSKEALLAELVKFGMMGPQFAMETMQPDNALGSISLMLTQIMQYVDMYPHIAKIFVLMTQTFRSDSTPACVRDIMDYNGIYHKSAALIEAGQKQGDIRSGDPLALSVAFWASLQGIMEAVALTPELPMPEADWIVDMLRAPRSA